MARVILGKRANTLAGRRHYIQATNVVSSTTHGTKIIFKNALTEAITVAWSLFKTKVSS